MERREFTRLLLGAAATAAMFSPSTAWSRLPARPVQTTETVKRAPVVLTLDKLEVQLSWFLIYHPVRMLGIDLRHPVPQLDENRIDVSSLAIPGANTRPLLAARFEEASLLGHLVLLGTLLVALPTVETMRQPARAFIAHRRDSWEPPWRPREVRIQGFPAVEELAEKPRIGEARMSGNDLALLIEPAQIGQSAGVR